MSTYFGFDLGASSLKVCKVDRRGAKKFLLENVGLIANPVGSIDFTKPNNKKELIVAIKKLRRESGIKHKRVVLAVPESHVYSRVVEMPVMSDSELRSAIRWEAEQFIPIPVNEVEMDYSVVYRPPSGSVSENMLVYLVASRKNYLESYVDFIVEAGLEPIAMENEVVATSRVFSVMDGISLVLHMGALTASMGIIHNGSLLFSHSVSMGGVAITRALAQSLSLQLNQAEQYKRTYGLNSSEFEGKVSDGILLVFSKIMVEVRKAMDYYTSINKDQIQRLILSGGGSYMPGLASYFTKEIPGVEVMVANPFQNAQFAKGMPQQPEVPAVYSVVVGLSLRQFWN